MIDGFVDHTEIVNCFSRVYKGIYKNSDANDKLKNEFNDKYSGYRDTHCNVSLHPFLFTWSDMLDAILSLKVGKATSTFIKAEHILCGCPELVTYLHLLFNGLLSHSYMPQEFLCGTIIPNVNPNGDSTASSNYRPITLGPIFLQIIEHLLLNKFGFYLETSNLQFG